MRPGRTGVLSAVEATRQPVIRRAAIEKHRPQPDGRLRASGRRDRGGRYPALWAV